MLNYRRYGRGPVVVMQHGFLGGSGYFLPQMAALGDAFEIIAPDLPGFAGSADEKPARSILDHSTAQIGLLDALGIERFSLLGHSMGGMIALQTALDHPDRVDRLILYATASSGELPTRFETFEETRDKVNRLGLADVAAKITASWFLQGEAAPMYPSCLKAGAGASLEAVMAALGAFGKWNVTERLRELKMPTLVIGADRDRSYSVEGLVRMAKSIEKAQLCLLPSCAHCAHLEKTDLFNRVIAEFLSSRGS